MFIYLKKKWALIKGPGTKRVFDFLAQRKGLLLGIIIALYVLAANTAKPIQALGENFESAVYTTLHKLRTHTTPHPDIIMVGVDTSSLNVLSQLQPSPEDFAYEPTLAFMQPQWPWNKAVFARALEKIAGAGAKLVLFDFVFISQSDGDFDFADALGKYRDRVVLASTFQNQSVAGTASTGAGNSLSFFEPNDDILPYNPEMETLESLDYSDMIGFANVKAASDKVVRRAYYQANKLTLQLGALGKPIPANANPSALAPDLFSLSALGAAKLTGMPPSQLPYPPSTHSNLINYAGPAYTYPMLPIEELFFKTRWENVLQGGAVFKNKIVVIGPYAEVQFKDVHPTPYGVLPGPEIQANQLANLLQGNFIKEVPPAQQPLLAIALLVLLWVCMVRLQSAWAQLGVLTVLLAAYTLLVYAAFNWAQVLLPTAQPLLGMFVCGNFALAYAFILEQYQRSRIKGMFGTYVSPELVDEMVASGEDPQLGGHEAEITAFFSDIQSFSSFSEVLTPEKLVDVMNAYLTDMTDILHTQRGTLDKYIGDAIVALFGEPIRLTHHAARGCACALNMQNAQAQLRTRFLKEGGHPQQLLQMRTRIGLNTGPVIVGNMGSANRFNYTMMGDNVNLAARCESGAKSYGAYNMVTEATYLQATQPPAITAQEAARGQTHPGFKNIAENAFLFRELDRIIVKGRTQPVTVYELLCYQNGQGSVPEDGPPLPIYQQTVELWNTALAQYKARNFSKAFALFERCHNELEPHNPIRCPGSPTTPSEVLMQRCAHYQQNPPPENWDGVFIMTSK